MNIYNLIYDYWVITDDNNNFIEYKPKPDTYGFIYKIFNINTGKFYIGKKSLMLGTNYKRYIGSNKLLKQDLKVSKDNNSPVFIKQVLRECKSKRELTYWEVYHQFTSDVLNPKTDTYNENIMGKFFKSQIFKSSPVDSLV